MHPLADPASRRLRRITWAALATNIGIVFSGGLVRVTGSGLGCPQWPSCDGTNLVPVPGGDHGGWQAAIEFGNRLLTFVVLAAAIAVFLAIRRTGHHPRGVRRAAWILPVGVVTQALVGGVTVLTGLTPITVAAHFLISMALIATAVVLHEYAGRRCGLADDEVAEVPALLRSATTVLAVVALAVLVLGTIVTGSGPHGGDLTAPRLPFDIRFVAIAHADAVWMMLGITVLLVVQTWRRGPERLRRAVRWLLAIEVAQGAIGYTQYVLGVPPALVAAHILGAALLWTLVVTVGVRARQPATGTTDSAAAEVSRR